MTNMDRWFYQGIGVAIGVLVATWIKMAHAAMIQRSKGTRFDKTVPTWLSVITVMLLLLIMLAVCWWVLNR
jgi:peptidoglycan biosynthesis protein MviN/MurJ (putative lipid II flippase)